MMRPSLARLASASAHSGSRPPPTALLPPLSLYRRLLRAHRKHLSAKMRILSDEYVRAEFRAHRNVDSPSQLVGFLVEWQLYAQKIEGGSWVGDKIHGEKLAKMSDQQIHQLYNLMQAIEHLRKDTEAK